jgi:CO/xanthine dehydrogenase FAD-binding subunit
MKAAPFDYIRPHSVEEACAVLADDADAAIIAGGQTLVPMMAMRLSRPSRLIDIARIEELHGIRHDGVVAVGAATRQVAALNDATIACQVPLLALALPFVGHAATRSRGTVGGSVANADPAAEIPLVLATLGGHIALRNGPAARTVAARDFFTGPMMAAMRHGDCIVALHFPVWHGRAGVGFQEVSARRGDFALASAAAQVALDPSGRCTACAVGIGGVAATPIRLDAAAEALIGSLLFDRDIADAVHAAVASIEIMNSPHASDGYRRRAAATLAVRALTQARHTARGNASDTVQ